VLCLADSAAVLELSFLGCESFLDVRVVAVLDVTVFDADHVVGVLFGEDFLVLDGLDGGVVMILVDFTIHGCLNILVVGASDVLIGHSWVDDLVDSGIVLSILGKESGNCCLCLIHFD